MTQLSVRGAEDSEARLINYSITDDNGLRVGVSVRDALGLRIIWKYEAPSRA